MNFSNFKKAVSTQIQFMIESGAVLLVTDWNGHALAEAYVDAYLPEDNPMFRERREHDCNCCKAFVRKVGNVVAIIDGKQHTIWDINPDNVDAGYMVVADKMAALVSSKPISNILRLQEADVGTDHNFELMEAGDPKRWEHFHHVMPEEYVLSGTNHPLNLVQNHKIALENSMQVSESALEIVKELVETDSLYRGAEKVGMMAKWTTLHAEFNEAVHPTLSQAWLWAKAYELGEFAALRGTAIGQLVDNISKGDELNTAVVKYEKMVAPENYKRSSAIVTKGMVDKAMKRVAELDIENALTRRAAVASDLTINNVLFADSSIQASMGVFDVLYGSTKANVPNLDKIEEVPVQTFLKDILPKADKLEIMMTNNQVNNLVSLVAPVDSSAKNILKWGNNFSWSYNGEVTDSLMRDRVKAAGGSVEGDVRFSIQWNEEKDEKHLDLDAHCTTPYNENIYFGNCEGRCGGVLDVDITNPRDKIAVENITWANHLKMPDGDYVFKVNNYTGTSKHGFKAELEILGEIHSYQYTQSLRSKQYIPVATVTKKGNVFTVKHHLDASTSSVETWGVHSQQFTQVDTVMFSPNHWDGEETGHKHLFFMLKGCINPDPVRGLYNEFLSQELHSDRKVFEVLGSKLRAPYSEEQLSGLGFSFEKRNELVCKVSGSFNRIIKIKF